MLEIDALGKKDNVFYYPLTKANKIFEKIYFDLRQKEGRIYKDDQVLALPEMKPEQKFYKEWQVRKKSLLRISDYLKKRNTGLNIMEFGCGNGWLSNHLSKIPFSEVYAVDINEFELTQGARIFRNSVNLKFVHGNIFENLFKEASFDIIIAACIIQYSNNLSELLNKLLFFLKQDGELHLIDNPLYKDDQIEAVKVRTRKYYEELGFPEMSSFYFHHSKDELQKFNYKYLYNPDSIKEKLRKLFFTETDSPFPWIRIIKV